MHDSNVISINFLHDLQITVTVDKILENFVTQCCDWPMQQTHEHDWLRDMVGIQNNKCIKNTAVKVSPNSNFNDICILFCSYF